MAEHAAVYGPELSASRAHAATTSSMSGWRSSAGQARIEASAQLSTLGSAADEASEPGTGARLTTPSALRRLAASAASRMPASTSKEVSAHSSSGLGQSST